MEFPNEQKETKNNQKNVKKIKIILLIGILTLISGLIFAPLSAWDLWYVAYGPTDVYKELHTIYWWPIIISFVLNLITSIYIVATDFQNEEVNKNKVLWGLLSLFLLGSIGIIIFATINLKQYGNYQNVENKMNL
ncbi:MAG: hypothetical protein ACRDCH_01315 [Metamycoplasmataceae bacterium]